MNGLLLNLAEVLLNKSQIELSGTAYDSDNWDEYIQTIKDYRFFRDRENIFAVPVVHNASRLPSEFFLKSISLENSPHIFERILEQSLVNLFRQYDYKVFLKKYSNIWTVELKSLEAPISFQGLKLVPHMDFEVHSFNSHDKSNKFFLGISLRKRYRPEFTYEQTDFDAKSIDTRDWVKNNEGKIIATRENIERYLLASGQSEQYFSKNKDLYSDEKFSKDVQELFQSVQKIRNRLQLPDGLRVTNLLLNHLPTTHLVSEQIRRPNYYYFNERTKSGSFYDASLAEMKPSSYNSFISKTVKILILTPKIYEGVVGSFSKRLESNLRQIFHLQKLEIQLLPVDNTGEYVNAIENQDLSSTDLVAVVLSDKDKEASISVSPYYLTKAKLLNQQIPSQDITIEKIKQQYHLIEKNIALNIYSKLGGVAWTIEKDEKDKKELVVGIGSALDFNGNKVIGFANVFDHNGTYLVGDCSHISTKENYVNNLETHLTSIIDDLIERKQIEKSTPLRLIFHLRKSAGIKTELAAINSALSRYGDYNIQFALLHLSYGHNFKLISNDGKYKVSRGTIVQLSPSEALLHLGGQDALPIFIKVDKRSTYKDLYALSQQVLYFSHLSHRSFKPANEPVTTRYPSIMASLTSSLVSISGWDVSLLNKLKEKLWFI